MLVEMAVTSVRMAITLIGGRGRAKMQRAESSIVKCVLMLGSMGVMSVLRDTASI